MELLDTAVFKARLPIAVVGRIVIVPFFLPLMRSNRAQQWKRNPASVRQSLQLRIMYTRVGDGIHLDISHSLRVSRKIGDARSQYWNSVVSAVAS